ncbi:MAG: type II toxin-antitoxin system HicB family antitoxin [Thaumarchaeota archaeon]|nr:type II toxin-antitoxin system HicB family antitoxin [Nitrososphaerota archaeon]
MKKAKIRQGQFTVLLREEEDGGYSAQCLELPGAISEGDNRSDALRNIREAIEGYLEAFPEEAKRLKFKKEVVKVTL